MLLKPPPTNALLLQALLLYPPDTVESKTVAALNLPPATAIYYNYHTIQKSVGTTACLQSEDWYSLLFSRATSR